MQYKITPRVYLRACSMLGTSGDKFFIPGSGKSCCHADRLIEPSQAAMRSIADERVRNLKRSHNKIILIRTVSYVSSTISTTFMTKHRIHVGWSQSPSKCFFRLRGRISNLKSCSHICTHASRFHQNTLSII